MHESSIRLKRVKALENGKGIQNLLSEAYEILGNPILLHDMEYKIIDYNKNVVSDDPLWIEYTTIGTVEYSWLEFFKNECFLEKAANAKKITFLLSDKLKYDRIYGKIFNKNNIQVGCAVLTASDKPFEDDDPLLFEEFCDVISKEIGADDFYNDYGQTYFEKLIDELIAGVDDIALYAAHVESIYMHLNSNLYLAVVDIGESNPTYDRLAYFRDVLKEAQPEYAYAIYSNYILIIIGTDEQMLYVEKDLNQLNRVFCEKGIFAGISSSFENLFKLNKYYEEACKALNKGFEIAGQHIFMYGHYKYDNL